MWCGTNSGDTSHSRPESARKTPREIQIKQEDLKSLVDLPRLPHAPELERFQFDAICEQQQLLKMTDGENARQCAKNTQLPEAVRIQGHTHQLKQTKK